MHTLIPLHYQSHYFKHLFSFILHFAPLCLNYSGFDSGKDGINTPLSLPLLVMKRLWAKLQIWRLYQNYQNLRNNLVMNPLLFFVGWLVGLEIFFLVFVIVMVCLLAGFAPYILWLGCYSNSKHGTANEYRQKSPKTCLLCLARGPAKRSRGAGTHNHFDFILPPPDEHQQKAVPFFLQREL